MNDGILNDKINKYFEITDEANKTILDQLALYIYYIESQKSQSDLYLLAKLLDSDSLYNIVDYYDGDTLFMPTKDEYKRSYLLGIIFFLKKIIGLDWEHIRKFLNISETDDELNDISPISLGRRINQIEEEINMTLNKSLKKIKVKDLKKLIKEVEEHG